ncbi:MAG: hypothetical protein PHQ59_04940 [Candidatus Daviesbacteria bacterium]|nr:hypothetical protein [Candidatus Daviesbacteria bacterium]
MSPEKDRPDEDKVEQVFGFEQDMVLEVVRRWQEKQLPAIDSITAGYYWRVRETLRTTPELKEKLEEVPEDCKDQYEFEFDRGGYHWKFIANKDNFPGDFRLALGDEEEARFVLGKVQNAFSYWNKRFAVSGGAKLFRGPNDSAARKIQAMLEKLDPQESMS